VKSKAITNDDDNDVEHLCQSQMLCQIKPGGKTLAIVTLTYKNLHHCVGVVF